MTAKRRQRLPVVMVAMFSIFRIIGDQTPFHTRSKTRPLWIGAFFGNAFNFFLLRQFFLTIPDEWSEAARIDGGNEFRNYRQLIFPMARPALTVIRLFTFRNTRHDVRGPLVCLQRPDQYKLALGLQSFQSAGRRNLKSIDGRQRAAQRAGDHSLFRRPAAVRRTASRRPA